MKHLPTVLIAKAKTEHIKSYQHGRAPDVEAPTKEKEVNMQTSKFSEWHTRK